MKRLSFTLVILIVSLATPAFAELKIRIKSDLSMVSIPKHGNTVGPWDLPMKDGRAEWKIENTPFDGDFMGFMTHEALGKVQKEKNLTIKVVSKASAVKPPNMKGLYWVMIQGKEAEAVPVIFESEKINTTWVQEGKWNGGYFFLDKNPNEWLKDKEGKLVYWTPEFGQ